MTEQDKLRQAQKRHLQRKPLTNPVRNLLQRNHPHMEMILLKREKVLPERKQR